MQFNSYIFIFAYVPILLMGYFLINRFSLRWGRVWLIAGSAFFYVYGGAKQAIILGCSLAVNYALSVLIKRTDKRKKIVLCIGVSANVLLLLYYKYFNFFIDNVNILFQTSVAAREIILALGISFFTFQQIMYLVNVYREEIDSARLDDYLFYVLYFPKILMGPLMEPTELIAQSNDPARKRVNWDNIACGLKTFSFGLFKKAVLADTFAAAVTWGFSDVDAATSMDWILIMLSYTFEIYFDFSGYSDMAVGVSKMLNIDLPINFDSPYKAISIRDFWKRWHISLTGFLTRYIYIPLGGSRKGKIRTYVNTMIVFLISGIWHGANWTFILWGVLHGLLSVVDRVFEKQENKLMDAVRWGGIPYCQYFMASVPG